MHGLHQIANAGVVVESNGLTIAIDALCGQLAPFYGPHPGLAEALIQADSPFDRLQALIITHGHTDHYDPLLVARFAGARPQVPIFAPPDVAASIRERAPRANLHPVEPAMHQAVARQAGDAPLEFIRLEHAGRGFENVINLACLMRLERTYLHTGDGDGNEANMRALRAWVPEQAVVLAPFPYLALPRSLELVMALRPELLYLHHLPVPGEDRFRWLRGVKRAMDHNPDVNAVLADPPGSVLRLDALQA